MAHRLRGGRRRWSLVLAAVLHRRLPGEQPASPSSTPALLASVVRLMRTEPLLRLRSAIGGLAFATFNVIWTSLAFLLVASPYHYSEAVIGLFGLLGAAGALAASFSGRLADRGLERWCHRWLPGRHRRSRSACWPWAPTSCGP